MTLDDLAKAFEKLEDQRLEAYKIWLPNEQQKILRKYLADCKTAEQVEERLNQTMGRN
jgi:hypothetical protein